VAKSYDGKLKKGGDYLNPYPVVSPALVALKNLYTKPFSRGEFEDDDQCTFITAGMTPNKALRRASDELRRQVVTATDLNSNDEDEDEDHGNGPCPPPPSSCIVQ
jgi:hypothetical protein